MSKDENKELHRPGGGKARRSDLVVNKNSRKVVVDQVLKIAFVA